MLHLDDTTKTIEQTVFVYMCYTHYNILEAVIKFPCALAKSVLKSIIWQIRHRFFLDLK